MSLKDEIKPNWFRNSVTFMVGPNKPAQSNNNLMYDAEYICLLIYRGESEISDCYDYLMRLTAHFIERPLGGVILKRWPSGAGGLEGPDDYLGVLHALIAIQRAYPKTPLASLARSFGRDIGKGFIAGLGSVNNEEIGKWTTRSFLVRQIQLVELLLTAAGFPLIAALVFPLKMYSGLVIAVSCRSGKVNGADPWRLSWHLARALCPTNVWVRMAYYFWLERLYATYGALGMCGPAQEYYEYPHPFQTYFVD